MQTVHKIVDLIAGAVKALIAAFKMGKALKETGELRKELSGTEEQK